MKHNGSLLILKPSAGELLQSAGRSRPHCRKRLKWILKNLSVGNRTDRMRNRILSMRQVLADEMKAIGVKRDFHLRTQQAGMFSFTGLTPEQVGPAGK